MKTQQRSFVVEIKSGRRRSKAEPKSIWGDTDFKALAREAEASHPFGQGVVADASSQNEVRPSDPKPQETPADIDVGEEQQVEAPLIAADQPTSQHQAEEATVSAVSQEQISTPKQPSRRGVNRRRDTKLERAVDGERNASVAVVAVDDSEPLSDEVAALAQENRHLRLLLAKQLRQENLQLREMLERFAIT